ncbi:MAG: hypothetical protein HQ579_03890 [Candidatus Omnitrophica bacterium]|nr:hypothetical protein [Candidatus Omnitrophota bacterium]
MKKTVLVGDVYDPCMDCSCMFICDEITNEYINVGSLVREFDEERVRIEITPLDKVKNS